MTIMDLYKIRDLKKDIEKGFVRLNEIKDQIHNIPRASLTGLPPKGFNTTSGPERYVLKVAEQEGKIIEARIQYYEALINLYQWMPSIPDAQVRLIIELYFVMGKSWSEVSEDMGELDGLYTESGRKARFYRYMKSIPQN